MPGEITPMPPAWPSPNWKASYDVEARALTVTGSVFSAQQLEGLEAFLRMMEPHVGWPVFKAPDHAEQP